MASSNPDDPYIDPETGILRNLVDATTDAALEDRERRFAAIRAFEIEQLTIRPTRDLTELQTIHRHLFQDIYTWAGEIRTVDIWKGGEAFGPVSMIPSLTRNTSATVAPSTELKQLSRTQFVERIANYYNDFNYIHPFREGNGRTQRIFLARITNEAGWDLDWNRVTPADNINACHHDRQTAKADELITLLDEVVIDLKPAPPRKADPPHRGAAHPTIGDKILPLRRFGWDTHSPGIDTGREIDD